MIEIIPKYIPLSFSINDNIRNNDVISAITYIVENNFIH